VLGLVAWTGVLAGLSASVGPRDTSRVVQQRSLIAPGESPGLPVQGLSIRGLGTTERAAASDASQTLARSPVNLQEAMSSVFGRKERQFAIVRASDGTPIARGGGLSTAFERPGPSMRAAGATLALRLSGLGYGHRLLTPPQVAARTVGNHVSYRHEGVTEWYRNGPLGLEQGFTLQRRPPSSHGWLTIAVRISGGLAARLDSQEVLFTRSSAEDVPFRYGGLRATDAAHRSLPVQLGLIGATLLLRIDDSDARYPLKVDPYIQQGSKLTASGGSFQFGWSVSLSADGNTALIGGLGGDTAWVFVRTGSTWTQQATLRPDDAISGLHSVQFGRSVALSADGNTALIGGPLDDNDHGASWVFVRSGAIWSQQGAKLTPTDRGPPTPQPPGGTGWFGSSVALSADGNTALIGGPTDTWIQGSGGCPPSPCPYPVGAAWVFTRSGSTWSQQGPKLTAAGSWIGMAVALSRTDGNTALVGGAGGAWVFVRSGSTWAQQGTQLTPNDVTLPSGVDTWFAESAALSSEGDTALIGTTGDSPKSAAWVFVREGSNWAQQGPKLAARDETGFCVPAGCTSTGYFGRSVALAGDGNTALIGGDADSNVVGAAWMFTHAGSTWAQQGAKLTARDENGAGGFGYSVAMSDDATTALIGGPSDGNGAAGAAWVFTSRPSLTVALPGTGSGAVTGSGISCPGTCSNTYPVGTKVALTATAAPGSTFMGWSGGGCSATGSCEITMVADTTVAAQFAARAPVNVGQPTLSGIVGAGQIVSCLPGTWSGAQPMTFTFMWLLSVGTGFAPVTSPSATSTYTVTAGDEGHSLACEVTASNDYGSTKATSQALYVAGTPLVLTTVDDDRLLLVSSFSDPTPLDESQYSATIDWGNGQPSIGEVVAGVSGTFNVSGRHVYLQSGSAQVTVSIARAGQSFLKQTIVVRIDPAHYHVELKAWIPVGHVVDPLMPFPLPAQLSVHPICRFPGIFLADTVMFAQYRGDSHIGYGQGYRVLSAADFDWNGRNITNFVIPSYPHYGTTHLDKVQIDPLSTGTCVEEKTVTSATAASTIGRTSFALSYSSPNPLQPLAPSIDGDLLGSMASDGTLALHYESDLIPSHGIQVVRDGDTIVEDVVNDASCIGEADLNGLSGLTLFAWGLTHEDNHDSITVPANTEGIFTRMPDAMCSGTYWATELVPNPIISAATSEPSVYVAPLHAGHIGRYESLHIAEHAGLAPNVQ
jgi:hypothetical protein